MPFEIVRNDITNMYVDAIVNTANPQPVIGSGTDAGIHAKAGLQLLQARQQIGDIPTGSAAVTPGFNLPARYVIHTVGPVWYGGTRNEDLYLRKCYRNCLDLAWDMHLQSIAFPLISTGNYGFPNAPALQIAMEEIQRFLLEHEMQVYLVVFHKDTFALSEKLFHGIRSFIDEHYVSEQLQLEYSLPRATQPIRETAPPPEENRIRRRRPSFLRPKKSAEPLDADTMPPPMLAMSAAPCPPPSQTSLEDFLAQTDAGFSETLLKLIDRSGQKDSVIYSRANVSRQHFSKIRNNPQYKPTKPTAIAFALALELDLEQTRDLIGRAGFALTASSKFDLIILYFIQQHNYNLYDINAALFEFDQPLLGA